MSKYSFHPDISDSQKTQKFSIEKTEKQMASTMGHLGTFGNRLYNDHKARERDTIKKELARYKKELGKFSFKPKININKGRPTRKKVPAFKKLY